MYDVQLINRVGWDGQIRPPDPNELGWKETVRMNPLEDAIVAIKKAIQKTFGHRGEVVVKKNYAAVDAALAGLHPVTIPAQPAAGAVVRRMFLPPISSYCSSLKGWSTKVISI